jgi:hypothetical protein
VGSIAALEVEYSNKLKKGMHRKTDVEQGCQMVCFQTKNPSLGTFGRVLLWKILVYFMTMREEREDNKNRVLRNKTLTKSAPTNEGHNGKK